MEDIAAFSKFPDEVDVDQQQFGRISRNERNVEPLAASLIDIRAEGRNF
jgi:hypothetical protein